MSVKLFDKVVEGGAIFKIEKADARVNLLIVRFTATLERTLDGISDE